MKPEIIKGYFYNGNLSYISYRLNGKKHRIDKPAEEYYLLNGNISHKYYYINGKFHRENGPAVIYYHKNGKVKNEYYYLNDKELTESEFLIYQRKRKLKNIL